MPCPEHYNQAAHISSARILEVPEEASRIAMFESGEAMITHVSLPNTRRLEEAGGVRRLLQTVILHIGMNPNFLEQTNPKTGEPLDNPGYDEAKKNPEAFPWVSFYDLPGSDCDWNVLLEEVPSDPSAICPEMENARKVRWRWPRRSTNRLWWTVSLRDWVHRLATGRSRSTMPPTTIRGVCLTTRTVPNR